MLTTEMSSHYNNLEKKSVAELLRDMNHENMNVPIAVSKALPQIEELIEGIVKRMEKGGRLFYIGAGTSGRLGVLDASECPPTFGVPGDWIIGIIAGGNTALRHSVENAEDDLAQGASDLEKYGFNKEDCVVGIAASGNTPYVIGALDASRKKGLLTGCIVCNANTRLATLADFPVEVITGPEFITGSTRMKAGTAQKMVLNMISTATMIRLGRVKDNNMVDMKLSNHKLMARGARMVMQELNVDFAEASRLITEMGSVRKVIEQKNAPPAINGPISGRGPS